MYRRNKYMNVRTRLYGKTFDSQKEAGRYLVLRDKEKNGEIKNLVLQPKYTLQEGFRDNMGRMHRPITYTPDFQYELVHKNDELGVKTVFAEDVKGMKTETYKIKKKLFIKMFPDIRFMET